MVNFGLLANKDYEIGAPVPEKKKKKKVRLRGTVLLLIIDEKEGGRANAPLISRSRSLAEFVLSIHHMTWFIHGNSALYTGHCPVGDQNAAPRGTIISICS